MTHLLLIYVPEKPEFKYKITVPFLKNDFPTCLIDFGIFDTKSSVYSTSGKPFGIKKIATFFGWDLSDLGPLFTLPRVNPIIRPYGVIGYHRWQPLNEYYDKDKWPDLDKNGWILTGDNHDFSSDELYAFLWIINIKLSKPNLEFRVFVQHGEVREITDNVWLMKDRINYDKLSPKTNPINNLQAILVYENYKLEPYEVFDYKKYYSDYEG